MALVVPLAAVAAPGDLDATFSGDGKKTTDMGAGDVAEGVGILPNGKIVVVGKTAFETGEDFAVARYLANGSLDNAFSEDGRRNINIVGLGDNGQAVDFDGGKIVVGGYTSGEGGTDMAVIRLNADGGLDDSFDDDGKLTLDMGGGDYATDIAVQPNGRIVVVGGRYALGVSKVAVARFNPDGTLDTNNDDTPGGFSGNGTHIVNFAGHDVQDAYGVALTNSGKVVLAATIIDGVSGDAGVARLNADGTPDEDFSGDGQRTVNFGEENDSAEGVAVTTEGKIVIGGTSGDAFAVARLKKSGGFDDTFDEDGMATALFDSRGLGDGDVALQESGKIVIAGSVGGIPDIDFAIARFEVDGDLDTGFGGGVQSTAVVSRPNAGRDIAIGDNDKPVVVGWAEKNEQNDFAVVRYEP